MSRKKSTIDDLFSERLKTLIEDTLVVSQKYFAEKIGISESYISAILKKRRGLSAELIVGLYIHYSQYLDWLLTGDREMTRQGPECDTCIYKVGETAGEDPKIVELMGMVKKVLRSGTDRADTLAVNIRSFYQGMIKNRETENRVVLALEEIKNRLDALEQVAHPPNKGSKIIREGDDDAQRGDILKKRKA